VGDHKAPKSQYERCCRQQCPKSQAVSLQLRDSTNQGPIQSTACFVAAKHNLHLSLLILVDEWHDVDNNDLQASAQARWNST
jgi:hypothetical protein